MNMSIAISKRLDSLKSIPLLVGLAESDLNFLSERAVTRHYKTGEPIFSEGEPCEGLYIIESGDVRVFKVSPQGREQVLTIERTGAPLAELPVFDDGLYPASASAVTNVTLLLIRKQDIRALCLEKPEVALKFLKEAGRRLRGLVDVIEQLSFTSVRSRLLLLLLQEAKRKGTRTPDGIEFALGATHLEIAARVGTVRELISRNLARFQAEGLIRLEGKKVIIPDLKRMENEMGEIK